MFICAAGDIHGAMDRLYDDVLAFEGSLGVRFDYVLHVGDFGVWPDPDRTGCVQNSWSRGRRRAFVTCANSWHSCLGWHPEYHAVGVTEQADV
jgi:hypothetical protein